MQTITFDGSKIFSINREKNGQINIFICENEIGLESGKVLESRLEDGLTVKGLIKLELPNEQTYHNLCRVLLSYATRSELVSMIGNPISWASYTVKTRRKSDEENKGISSQPAGTTER